MVTASTHTQLVDHIKTSLEATPDITGADGATYSIGTIHTFPRDLQRVEDIYDAFASGTPARINAWVIQRERIGRDTSNVPSKHEYRYHHFVIRGYFEMADDLTSETTFQEMLTAILDTLIERRQVATDAATARFEDTAELNVRFIGLSQIGGVHCHVAEIAWVLKERIKAIDYKGIG